MSLVFFESKAIKNTIDNGTFKSPALDNSVVPNNSCAMGDAREFLHDDIKCL